MSIENFSSIAIGESDFYILRKQNFYYIDKTAFIEELLTYAPCGVNLITRPRRFGKTLNLSMLKEFFTIRKRGEEKIFTGLAIDKNKGICSEWQNKFPVLSLSLKSLHALEYESMLDKILKIIQYLCLEYSYLFESDKVSESIKLRIKGLEENRLSENDLAYSLKDFCYALYQYYNCQVIVLIDEYDVSLNCAYDNNYYDKMIDFFRTFVGDFLKDNPLVKLAVLTGCLRIAKESIFTGFNNFRCYSILDNIFADKFGFTNSEVDKILHDFCMEDKKEEIKDWYDGYSFGGVSNLYCPWDVLNYVFDVKNNKKTRPSLYWINTSENNIIKQLVEKTDLAIDNKRGKVESLLRGEDIEVDIDENLTFRNLYTSESTFFTLLFMSGYLTKQSECEAIGYDDTFLLSIPNKEIKTIIKRYAREWFKKSIRLLNRDEFFYAFWNGDERVVGEKISDILLQYISFYDSHYEFCHGFVAGLFIGSGYIINSNKEYGEGCPDIVVHNEREDKVAIIEVKYTDNIDTFDNLSRKALQQIENMGYDTPFLRKGCAVLHCGLAFYKKQCRALFYKKT